MIWQGFLQIFRQAFWQTRNIPDVARYAEALVYASLAHIRDILFLPTKGAWGIIGKNGFESVGTEKGRKKPPRY